MLIGSHSCFPASRKVFQEEKVTKPLEKVLENKREEKEDVRTTGHHLRWGQRGQAKGNDVTHLVRPHPVLSQQALSVLRIPSLLYRSHLKAQFKGCSLLEPSLTTTPGPRSSCLSLLCESVVGALALQET